MPVFPGFLEIIRVVIKNKKVKNFLDVGAITHEEFDISI